MIKGIKKTKQVPYLQTMRISFLLVLMCVVTASIQWKSYDEGINEVENQKKPGIVLIHHSTCPACINLNKIFQNSERIEELSKQFVMMSCKNGKEPNDIGYKGGFHLILFIISRWILCSTSFLCITKWEDSDTHKGI